MKRWISPDIHYGFYCKYLMFDDDTQITYARKITAYRTAEKALQDRTINFNQRDIVRNFIYGSDVYVRRMDPKETEFLPLMEAMISVYAHSNQAKPFDPDFNTLNRTRLWHWLFDKSTYVCRNIKDKEITYTPGTGIVEFPEGSIITCWADCEKVYHSLMKKEVKFAYRQNVLKGLGLI